MTSPSSHKTNFDLLVGTSLKWLDWVEGTSRLQNIVKGNINFQGLKGDDAKFVTARLNEAVPQRQLFLNSIYISLIAGFEEYLRATLKNVANNLNNSAQPPSAHKKDLMKLNVKETVRLLRRIDSPPDYISFNEDDLCRVIGSCVVDSSAVLFNGEALSDVDGLIRLVNFCERATSLGKKVDLDVLAKDNEVKRALNLNQNASTREVRKLLEKELGEVSRFRNRIAHTGGNASDVTEPILRSHKTLLAAVASAIEKHI